MMIRTCLGCLQNDDHPKHVIGVRDGADVAWHMDCHATTGCPSCTQQTRDKGEARGDEFRAILTGGA